jgi:CheY-like chemotaxis protein
VNARRLFRREQRKAETMKRQIVLESPVVPSFDRVKISHAAVREAGGAPSTPKCRLECPPNGDTLPKAFNTKTALALAESRRSHSQRILVVEDEVAVRQYYYEALGRSGYQVDAAEDGEAGWNALHAANLDANGYDLLITDNRMPKLSDVELIQKLRSAHVEVPVILASGALPANADGLHLAAILPKPFSLDQLLQTVRHVLHVAKNE